MKPRSNSAVAEIIPAILAAVIALAGVTEYLAVIFAQGRELAPMRVELGVWFIAGYAAAGGVLAAASIGMPRGRAYALAAAAGMIAFIGTIGMVSSLALTFGLPLLAAAALAGVASARARTIEGTSKAAALATALLAYLGGLGGYFAAFALGR